MPEDLILTPLTCLIWYIGDGGICHGNRTESIRLATNCFLKEELENILIPQLKNFEAALIKSGEYKNGEPQYIIYIPHRKEKAFLNYIGECPFEDYKYKWEVKEYINKPPVMREYTELDKEFCELYLNGKTYYEIAKKFNLAPAIIRRRLIKNNIYKIPDKKTKNAIIHLSQDNEYINIYESGVAAGRELNLSSSMISSVKSGNKKMKDNSYFKSYKDFNKEEQQIIQEKFQEYFK